MALLAPRPGRALDVIEDFAAAAAIAADDVAVAVRAQVIEIVAGHHAAVADKHDAPEAEALLQIAQHLRHRLGVAPVAGEHMMGDRPAVDHDDADQHLAVARLAVAAVPMGTQRGRPLALEIGRGQVIEHEVDAQRKQVAQREKQGVFDLRLERQQLIERAVPVLELARLDPHPRRPARLPRGVIAPRRHEAAAVAVADEVGLQPARQAMLAPRRRQPIGDQDQSLIAQRGGIATMVATLASDEPVERHLKPKLAPQMARRQHRSPIPRRHGVDILAPDRSLRHRLAMQQAHQLGEIEMRRQQVLATQIEHGAMARLAALAIGFDHPHVFMLDAFAAGGADDAQEHGPLRTLSRDQHHANQQMASTNSAISSQSLSLRFGENRTLTSTKSTICHPPPPRICQTWASVMRSLSQASPNACDLCCYPHDLSE